MPWDCLGIILAAVLKAVVILPGQTSLSSHVRSIEMLCTLGALAKDKALWWSLPPLGWPRAELDPLYKLMRISQ